MSEQQLVNSGAQTGGRIAALRAGQGDDDYWPVDVRRAATTEEELFCLFVGPNAGKFMKLYRAIATGEGRTWNFNWVAWLFGTPWLFYRRMYLAGTAILLVPILLVLVFPELAQAGVPSFGVALGFVANHWYVTTAMSRIKKITALELSREEQNERIYQAGGVSVAGAIFGAVIVVALAVLPFIAGETLTMPLPGCDSPRVQHLAKESIAQRLKESGVRAMGLKLTDFEAVRSAADGSSHICQFQVSWGQEQYTYYLGLSWNDRATGEYRVNMGPSMDGLVP